MPDITRTVVYRSPVPRLVHLLHKPHRVPHQGARAGRVLRDVPRERGQLQPRWWEGRFQRSRSERQARLDEVRRVVELLDVDGAAGREREGDRAERVTAVQPRM